MVILRARTVYHSKIDFANYLLINHIHLNLPIQVPLLENLLLFERFPSSCKGYPCLYEASFAVDLRYDYRPAFLLGLADEPGYVFHSEEEFPVSGGGYPGLVSCVFVRTYVQSLQNRTPRLERNVASFEIALLFLDALHFISVQLEPSLERFVAFVIEQRLLVFVVAGTRVGFSRCFHWYYEVLLAIYRASSSSCPDWSELADILADSVISDSLFRAHSSQRKYT